MIRLCCRCGAVLRMTQYFCSCGHRVQGCRGIICNDARIIGSKHAKENYSEAAKIRWLKRKQDVTSYVDIRPTQAR